MTTAVSYFSLVHCKAETKLVVIIFTLILMTKQSHTNQVKNKMCKTKSQMRQEDLIFALLTAESFHSDSLWGLEHGYLFLSSSSFTLGVSAEVWTWLVLLFV